jgi:DNA-binding NarL/FixJ family response regulator
MTPSDSLIHILMVDDHQILRAGLRMLIESSPKMVVVGEAGNCRDALFLAANTQPDIILLDISLGQENGLDCLTGLFAAAESARAIILTGSDNPAEHHRAVALGAMGVVYKEQASQVLLKAIECVHAGEVWMERSMIARVLNELAPPGGEKKSSPEMRKISLLTEAERKIVALLCEGLTNKQLAERLFLSESTIQNHLTSIFSKLDVSNRLSLVIYAFREGLVEPKQKPTRQ